MIFYSYESKLKIFHNFNALPDVAPSQPLRESLSRTRSLGSAPPRTTRQHSRYDRSANASIRNPRKPIQRVTLRHPEEVE
jgi:hypothetical protein